MFKADIENTSRNIAFMLDAPGNHLTYPQNLQSQEEKHGYERQTPHSEPGKEDLNSQESPYHVLKKRGKKKLLFLRHTQRASAQTKPRTIS